VLPIEPFRADLADLAAAAQDEVASLLSGVTSRRAAERMLTEALPDIVSVYGDAAGALAADWYDEVRSALEVPGRFRAVAGELPDVGRTDSLAEWATRPLADDPSTIDTVITRAQGGTQRIVMNVGRDTVTYSAVHDPSARGWQRAGAGECNFCKMLIGRGAVYRAETADFGAHDHCKCIAVPAWGGRPVPVKPFAGSARGVSDAERARVHNWMLAHT